jgi:dihydrofolate reductase
MQRKLILYIAMSLDGYIATKDDNIDFLSRVESPGEDFGYASFSSSVDTIIWGRRTFDKVLTFGGELPHKDKAVYVISRNRTGEHEHVQFKNDVVKLVNELKSREGKNIYCDGGGEIVFELLKHRLFDRLIVSVIPHLLGDGIRLFKSGFETHELLLKQSVSYPSGLVQLWYDVKKGLS